MAASDKDPVIPGLIGNFNIPKSVIENKVDVLTFLELLVRKGMVTAEELDDIRGSVVAHLNAQDAVLPLFSSSFTLISFAFSRPFFLTFLSPSFLSLSLSVLFFFFLAFTHISPDILSLSHLRPNTILSSSLHPVRFSLFLWSRSLLQSVFP